jgi:hypothetical protein
MEPAASVTPAAARLFTRFQCRSLLRTDEPFQLLMRSLADGANFLPALLN